MLSQWRHYGWSISLLLCAAVCVLWARVTPTGFTLARTHGFPTAFWLYAWPDGLFLMVRQDAQDVPAARADWRGRPSAKVALSRWGFGSASTRLWDGAPPGGRVVATYRHIGIGYKSLLLLGMVVPTAWLASRRLARARILHAHKHRLCPGCGYDLRATPGRCPECGAVPGRVSVRTAAMDHR